MKILHQHNYMVLNGMLTCEASRLCPHNPAGFAADIHIALPLVEEDATRPHRSISWGIALAKEAYHVRTLCSKGTGA